MTVKELREQLEQIPNQNAEVKILTGDKAKSIAEVTDHKTIVLLEA